MERIKGRRTQQFSFRHANIQNVHELCSLFPISLTWFVTAEKILNTDVYLHSELRKTTISLKATCIHNNSDKNWLSIPIHFMVHGCFFHWDHNLVYIERNKVIGEAQYRHSIGTVYLLHMIADTGNTCWFVKTMWASWTLDSLWFWRALTTSELTGHHWAQAVALLEGMQTTMFCRKPHYNVQPVPPFSI